MKLVERYIFLRIGGATIMLFVALGAMVWLAQALRQFDLVTAKGQSLMTFFVVSALLLPSLLVVVLPVAMTIAVIYTFSSLNTDSELVVINASGASQITILRPVAALGLLATLILGTMSLYVTPLTVRTWRDLITEVRGDLLSTIIREGQFISLSEGLTFHMRERNIDGSFGGIFVSDSRDGEQTRTYLAERGALLENPLGTFLIMSGGTIQQRNATDGSISIIEFSSYAFDLTSFTSSSGEERTMFASEQPTSYLLNPDPDDRSLRQNPAAFRMEIHKRLVSPLNALIFAILPLVFLGQAESARQSRTTGIAAAIFTIFFVQVGNVMLPAIAESNVFALIAMYALPLLTVATAVVLVLSGVRVRPPEAVVAFGEALLSRIGGTARGRAPAGSR